MIKFTGYYQRPSMKTTIYEGLLGQVMRDINISDREATFEMSDGRTYKVIPDARDNEKVHLESMSGALYGGLDNLLGTPLLLAESEYGIYSDKELGHKEKLWTAYTFATLKGSVTITWVGADCGPSGEVVGLFQEGVSISEQVGAVLKVLAK